MPTTIVYGGYGELTVDRETGNVLAYERGGDCCDCYGNNLEPYEIGYDDIVRVFIPPEIDDGMNTDIVLCGIYYADAKTGLTVYAPPCTTVEEVA